MPDVISLASLLTGAEPTALPVGDHAALSYLPAVNARTPGPALVWIHGGAWKGGDKSAMWPQMRYFARRGLASFSIGYRRIAPGGPTLADAVADCRAALRLIRARAGEFAVDPERIAVAGDSAGGHLAACLAALPDTRHDGSRPDLAILCNPITDLTDGTWATQASAPPAPGETAPAPTPAQLAWALDWSPHHLVQPPQPPTYLLHGLQDAVVPYAQSERYHQQLTGLGVASTLDLIPGAGHAFVITGWKATPPQIVDAWRRIDAYLARQGYVTGAPELDL